MALHYGKGRIRRILGQLCYTRYVDSITGIAGAPGKKKATRVRSWLPEEPEEEKEEEEEENQLRDLSLSDVGSVAE